MDEKRQANEQSNSAPVDAISPSTNKDYDETYEVYKTQDARAIDPIEVRRVLRKIEWHMYVPITSRL